MRPFSGFHSGWLCLAVFLVTCNAVVTDEGYALNAFKEAIYDDPFMALSNWNTLDEDPCNWNGISCSYARGHVVKLNFSGSSLKGFLAPELGLLSSLQELILHGNHLIGTIPKEIGMLKNLRILDLGINQLTGPIPAELGKLTSLVQINLQSNLLTGKLPDELGNLKNLGELRLDRNKLEGIVPGSNSSGVSSNFDGKYASVRNVTGFCLLFQLTYADFSHNRFVGGIPKCLGYLPTSSFLGNCFQDKDNGQRPTEECGNAPPPKGHSDVYRKSQPVLYGKKHQPSSKPGWVLALEVVTGILVGVLFVVAIFTAFHRCKSKSSIIFPWKRSASDKNHKGIFIDSENLKGILKYSRQEIEIACEDFSNIIGSSPDSIVYKGNLKRGPEIAAISFCIKEEHWSGFLELYFQREVADLARLNHENTGKLLGYCRERIPFTRMLVFEYASNGTLYEHLHYGEGCLVSWTRRMKIVLGIARGLTYLHEELHPPFTISKLDSSAVYLTEDFSPKLVDFDSWMSILSRSQKNSGAIRNEGDICVLPNSIEARHLDVQGNIYAFGVLLLEIVSGRLPNSKDTGCLVDWAKDFLEQQEAMPRVVDPALKHFKADELQAICEVVILCIHPDPSKRPSMREVSETLESRIDTSVSAELQASSLAWADLTLSSN